MTDTKPMPKDVSAAFDHLPTTFQKPLLDMRNLILNVAQSDPRIGALNEVLRWGDPAYITARAKTGSTIRLGVEKASGQPAVFFNCQTTLVEEFRQTFGDTLSYSKNRAVLIDGAPQDALRACVASALTYHLK
jgi:hypothetical protein